LGGEVSKADERKKDGQVVTEDERRRDGRREGGRHGGTEGGRARVYTYPIGTEAPGGKFVLEFPHAKGLVDEPQLFRVHVHGYSGCVLISVLRVVV